LEDNIALFSFQTFLNQILDILLHVQWFEIGSVPLSRVSCVIDQEFLEIPRDVGGAYWRVEKIRWITDEGGRVWTERLKII
jgi:hypothetical protein